MDDELEKMMQEALDEARNEEGDSTSDESEQEESIRESNDNEENSDNRQDNGEDKETPDQEDDGSLDEEVEQEEQDNSEEIDEEIDENNQEEQLVDFQPIEVEINGQKISIDNKEEMLAFIKQGASSMAPKKQRKSQNDRLMEQSGLSQADIQLLVDAKNGNKAALAKLAQESKIDLYDIDEEAANSYTPEFKPVMPSEIDEVAEEILENDQLAQNFQSVISAVPEDFTQAIVSSPETLRNFANQVESGLAQEVMPQAMKYQMLHGGTLFDAYSKVGQEVYNKKQNKTSAKKIRKTNPRADELRRKAASKKGSTKGTKTTEDSNDIWNMSDKDFEKKYM